MTTREALTTTLLFSRSDRPVCSPVSIRNLVMATQAVARPIVPHIRNPSPAWISRFSRKSYPGLGTSHGVFPDLVCLDPFRTFHIIVLELMAVILALQHWVSVLQGHHVMIATDNITVVAYVNKQGGTHSHTLLRLVVDLFLWLQSQELAIQARHIPGCLNVILIADRLSRLNQPITTEWSFHPELVNLVIGSFHPKSTNI